VSARTRGEYRFSSLMKQKKRGENYAVFCFAAFFLNFFCYEVIVKQKKKALLITTRVVGEPEELMEEGNIVLLRH